MSKLTAMMNIGKEMARKLTSVGIDTPEKLIELGSKQAFAKLKEAYPNVCLVHLYTLEGAIYNTEYNRLSDDTKKELKEFSDSLKCGTDNSVPTYEIRKVTSGEVDEALNLALETFMQFEAPDYKLEGVETFKSFIGNEKLIQGFKSGITPMYAAFDNGKIIGIMGMRVNKTHINLVFTKKEYHRKGVATAIFKFLLADLINETPELSEITLNSSPYGLPFYLKLGFVPQSGELEEDGIRYTPMKFDISVHKDLR